ncbi:MAG: hypothetical protein B9S38_14445 [Verrucomicrobiia bacterium Tous-C4TDCM]|nr:MAG: hypothetical protein B9S38_14445 [Verrucomicrobiae bacterium Tous-C4TDCM]
MQAGLVVGEDGAALDLELVRGRLVGRVLLQLARDQRPSPLLRRVFAHPVHLLDDRVELPAERIRRLDLALRRPQVDVELALVLAKPGHPERIEQHEGGKAEQEDKFLFAIAHESWGREGKAAGRLNCR